MTDPIEEKIKKFTERLVSEDASVVIPEAITYLEGIKDNEKDPMQRELISGYIISLNLGKSVFNLATNIKNKNDKLESQLNSSLERIIKLEKRFDDLDAGK